MSDPKAPIDMDALLRERAAERDEIPPLDPAALERAAALLTDPASSSTAQTEDVVQLMADDPDIARAVLLCQSMDETTPPARMAPRGWIPALAAAAAILLTSTIVFRVARERDSLTSKGDSPATQLAPYRGPDAIAVARVRNGITTTLRPGDAVQTNDQLTVFYSSASAAHLAVLAVDASGDVNWIVPGDGWLSIEAGDTVALPHGIRVGEGTSCEWLVAVFADSALPREEWEQRVSAAAQAATQCRMSLAAGSAKTVRVFGVTR